MIKKILTPLLICISTLFVMPSVYADGADGLGIFSTATSSSPTTPPSLNGADLTSANGIPTTSSDAPVAQISVPRPQNYDYSANLKSNVFGANLFTGAFAGQGAAQFNPNYAITVGDRLQVRLWGAYTFEALLTVDPRGNIFLPNVGPVNVLGVQNQDLQQVVKNAVAKVFRANVFSYASLAAAQPVRIYVSGYVNRPGAYSGTSMDSLLHYLDLAGGIDLDRGSFLSIQVRRGNQVRANVNLYDFLLHGNMPQIQLADGDIIFVNARKNIVTVSGLADNAKVFEFEFTPLKISDLIKVAKPMATATNVRVTRNSGPVKNVDYFLLSNTDSVDLKNGDELAFTSDKKPGTITVRVEGEHESSQEYVLPYGSKLGALLGKIKTSERSDFSSAQLFRESVKERQALMLQTSLRSLEAATLNTRSATSEEAKTRADDATLVLKWIDKAKLVVPTGQVVIANSKNINDILLENGDLITIPTKDSVVLVSGQVLFPNTIVYDKALSVDDYLKLAGGLSQDADSSRVVIAHPDGSYTLYRSGTGIFERDARISVRAGDQIMVLPNVDVKTRQFWKDVSQIIFQIAVAAKVVVGL
jgi:protein involved in polysaccharide export with SLBB domain